MDGQGADHLDRVQRTAAMRWSGMVIVWCSDENCAYIGPELRSAFPAFVRQTCQVGAVLGVISWPPPSCCR